MFDVTENTVEQRESKKRTIDAKVLMQRLQCGGFRVLFRFLRTYF